MNSATYRNVVRLLENWPVDASKKGRDFGEFIRYQVGTYFSVTSQANIKDSAWDDITLRLNKLASNQYKKQYPVSKASSCSGLSLEECNIAISTESLKELDEEFSSTGRFVGRIKGSITHYFRKD